MVNVAEIHSCEGMQRRVRVFLLIPIGFGEDGGVGDGCTREYALGCSEKKPYLVGNVSVIKALVWQKVGL